MQHNPAAAIAVAICHRLAPHCFYERTRIAGSIRRKKPEVKDIEIVCLPKYEQVIEQDLFGQAVAQYRDANFISTAISLGKVLKGSPEGRYMQIELPEGINIDLFMPMDYDYFRQLAIRTGSADYAAQVIAAGWRAKGWVGTPAGLRLERECRRIADHKWECTTDTPTAPPVWDSELDFFQWIGVEWVKPEDREVVIV